MWFVSSDEDDDALSVDDAKPKAKPKAKHAAGGSQKKKKKKEDQWVTSDARALIMQDMIDDKVPINEPIKNPRKLYNELYRGHPFFENFPYIRERFAGKCGRFASLQNIVRKSKERSDWDKMAFEHDMAVMKAKGPPTTTNNKGQPLWRDSEADHWLDVDMLAGKHLSMDPKDLFETRECYQPFGPVRFAKRIDQKKQQAKPFSNTPGQIKSRRDAVRNRKDISRRYILDPYVNDDGSEEDEEEIVEINPQG